jgi:hypothetical protein
MHYYLLFALIFVIRFPKPAFSVNSYHPACNKHPLLKPCFINDLLAVKIVT